MVKNLRWKVLLSIGVLVGSLIGFYPPRQKIKLGLDLKGGVHMILAVKTDDALNIETDGTIERLREELRKRAVNYAGIAKAGPAAFHVDGLDAAQERTFRDAANELSGMWDFSAGAGKYDFRMKPNVEANLRDEAVSQALLTIERRVNELGVAEPVVARTGTGDRSNQLLVQLPGVTDIGRAKEIIRSTALLELKIVEGGPGATKEALLQASGGAMPPDQEVVPGAAEFERGQAASNDTVYYLVRKAAGVTGRDLKNARPQLDRNSRPAIGFTLTPDGARKFGRLTSENIGRRLAIILDGRVQTAPTIESRITDSGEITGSFTQEQANDLSIILKSGALPASLNYLEERTVGPSLGADAIRSGIIASLVGLTAVVLFLLVYYKLSGVNAIIALTFNLAILLAMMAYFGATLTLPGIAGIILTIGMGVDSNVLIFERIREELRSGKAVRTAIANGFNRVFGIIIDTHLATLISAAFLFQFGTGPIRGFAVTLAVGLLANIFTSMFVSKTVYDVVLSRRQQVTTLSI